MTSWDKNHTAPHHTSAGLFTLFRLIQEKFTFHLILYYSYRGNTQRIAERNHAAIGGDFARIDTVVPYTGSYDDVVAQGEQEVKCGFLPELNRP